MSQPAPMSVDTRRFTQPGIIPSTSRPTDSSGTSSVPSICASANAPAQSDRSKPWPKLNSFVTALNSFVTALNIRDYTSRRVERRGEEADIPTVSALLLTKNMLSLADSAACSQGARPVVAMDSTITHITRCFRQLDDLDAGMASLSIKTNLAYWQLGMAYEVFCKVSQFGVRVNDMSYL